LWQARRKTIISDKDFDRGIMKKNWCCQSVHVPPHVVTSLALSQYHFSTPEIRLLMRHILGYALSGRTIKRLAKSAGRRLKRGRPKTTPRVQKKQLNDLIETTSAGLEVFDGNALHFLHRIQLEFGLEPRQYLKWVAQSVRRGKCMMRQCLLCQRFFPSLDSGERYCAGCQRDRRRAIKEERSAITGY
jgi:hypothetical protein